MRVAVVASRFPVLSETFVVAQVAGLVQRGHDVTVFADRPSAGDPMHASIARYGLVSRTRYWSSRVDLPFVWRATRSAAREPVRVALALWRCAGRKGGNRLAGRAVLAAGEKPFDAIVCHFGSVAAEAQQLREVGALSGKLVAVFHAFDLTKLLREKGRNYYDALFARAELLLPVSRHGAARLEALGGPVHKIAVHHMGVDCGQLSFSARNPPEPGGPMEIISVARLVEKKGIADAVDAVAALVKDGVAVRYRIIGAGPLRRELSERLRRHGLEDHVQLLGPRGHEEVTALLDRAHVLLAPSVTASDGDEEGIPVSIMEAMAKGLVVVSTLHAGIPELVIDGETGYLVPERDVAGLTSRLRELASHPERWPDLGRAGRATVEKEFNQERLDDALEARLQSL